MPQADVNAVEEETPGFVDARLATHSARIDSRLRKRYAVPFAKTPYPEAVLEWVTKLVTYELYLKRGVDPSDQTLALVKADKEQAEAEVKEAADAQGGLFDLPLPELTDASAITKGGPLSYTEASPYVFTDSQSLDGRREDRNGRGT